MTINAPLEARDALDGVFAPFLAGAADAPGEGGLRSELAVACQEVNPGGKRVGAAAITTAGVAVTCGVCCVLPFAFPAVALTAFGSLFAAIAGVYWWALSVSVVVVVAGWAWVGWQSLRTGQRAAPSTMRAMALATLCLAAALSWPFMESQIIAMLRS